jgi:hypothetical protein
MAALTRTATLLVLSRQRTVNSEWACSRSLGENEAITAAPDDDAQL